jgi:hypothetical protein
MSTPNLSSNSPAHISNVPKGGGVVGDTRIITDVGYVNIRDFTTDIYNVWDGSKFVPCSATPASNISVVEIKTSNGDVLRCSQNFIINDTPVKYLPTNSILMDMTFPEILKDKKERCERILQLGVKVTGKVFRDYAGHSVLTVPPENKSELVQELRLLGATPDCGSFNDVMCFSESRPGALKKLLKLDFYISSYPSRNATVESIFLDGTSEDMFILSPTVPQDIHAFYNGVYA